MKEAASEFDELDSWRQDLVVKKTMQPSALALFHDEATGGFKSNLERPDGHLSPSSTATCISSLVASSQWVSADWSNRSADLVRSLIRDDRTTRGLEPGNVYTVAFMLEAVNALRVGLPGGSAEGSDNSVVQLLASGELTADIDSMVSIVERSLADGHARIENYPPSGYMTQLAVRVLKHYKPEVLKNLSQKVTDWAWSELHRQLALILAKSASADLYQLAYCAITLANFDAPRRATPDQRLLVETAIEQLFTAQLPDGTWPRSAPIFDIPGRGSAYCYESELLLELLSEWNLEESLLEFLPYLRVAYTGLIRSAYELPNGALAWASGHHGTPGPEAWATAASYHFIHVLERLVAEAIRRSVFRYLRNPYIRPVSQRVRPLEFAPNMLDSMVRVSQKDESLKTLLFSNFVKRVAQDRELVEAGSAMRSETPNTAIFFGPPGTSKTELTRAIAEYLGWPRLVLDPSNFVRYGIDHVSAEADRLFGMLEAVDRVVVLLDEIDELVRDRVVAQEVVSRFLTTSMLPKLARINKSKRLVFVVATNHIEQFDIAISRAGRFDLILQVMPPSYTEKLKRFRSLVALADVVAEDATRRNQLNWLTYDEAARLASRLQDAQTNRAEALAELDAAYEQCTLKSPVDRLSAGSDTWQEVCNRQVGRIRIPESVKGGDGADA